MHENNDCMGTTNALSDLRNVLFARQYDNYVLNVTALPKGITDTKI